jgi:hypothetical protein
MSTIRVNAIQSTSTTDGGISIDSSGHVTLDGQSLPSAGPLSNRNLIINGAMQVAQRGTSSTSDGYQTVDRYRTAWGQVNITQSQQTLSSGDPYNEGFRYFHRTANTATSTSNITWVQIEHKIEAQNVAQSGWNYTNSNSFLTCSFWARSSVAGTYYVQYRAGDMSNFYFNRSFTLAADTWTKVSHTIPGESTFVVNNDNGSGLEVIIVPHYGTGYQGSTATDGSWFTLSGNDYFPSSSYSQDWGNTASATFDITGVQLEVGSVATPFEHRSYGDELARCQRYYCLIADGNNKAIGTGGAYSAGNSWAFVHLPVEMRVAPSLDYVSGTGYYTMIGNNASDGFNNLILEGQTTSRMARVSAQANISLTQGLAYFMQTNNASAKVAFSAEL